MATNLIQFDKQDFNNLPPLLKLILHNETQKKLGEVLDNNSFVSSLSDGYYALMRLSKNEYGMQTNSDKDTDIKSLSILIKFLENDIKKHKEFEVTMSTDWGKLGKLDTYGDFVTLNAQGKPIVNSEKIITAVKEFVDQYNDEVNVKVEIDPIVEVEVEEIEISEAEQKLDERIQQAKVQLQTKKYYLDNTLRSAIDTVGDEDTKAFIANGLEQLASDACQNNLQYGLPIGYSTYIDKTNKQHRGIGISITAKFFSKKPPHEEIIKPSMSTGIPRKIEEIDQGDKQYIKITNLDEDDVTILEVVNEALSIDLVYTDGLNEQTLGQAKKINDSSLTPLANSIFSNTNLNSDEGGYYSSNPAYEIMGDNVYSPLKLYKVSMGDDMASITIDPANQDDSYSRSISFETTQKGGIKAGLGFSDDGKRIKFTDVTTKKVNPIELIQKKISKAVFQEYTEDGYFNFETGYLNEQDAIYREGVNGDSGYLFLSKDPNKPGLMSVCKEVSFFDFNNPPSGGFDMRKPVIYIYGNHGTDIKVSVKLNKKASFTHIYPEMNMTSGWQNVRTHADNTVSVGASHYPYLFWEADCNKDFKVDLKKSYCVQKKDVVSFLEKNLSKLGMNNKEITDFITYWMAELSSREYAIIQFLGSEYEKYAKLHVSPAPQSMHRVYMIFQSSDTPVVTGNPVIRTRKARAEYAVVERGGSNLGVRKAVDSVLFHRQSMGSTETRELRRQQVTIASNGVR